MRQPSEIYLNGNNSTEQITLTHETSKVFSYNGNNIFFDIKDDVMVNATQLAKIYGKRPNDYLSLPSTNQLIDAITRKYGIAENQVIRTERGGCAPGTWMHRLIVVDFCQWLDIDLKLWCTERLDELMRYGLTATQPTLEQIINNPDLIISLATQLKNEREEKARLLSENTRLLPKASFVDKIIDTGGKIDVGQAAKLLKLPFGRNKLFEELRKTGIFFKNRNEPKQQYIESGYFELREQYIERKDHPGFTVIKVLVTQKGLEFLNRLLNGEKSDGKMMKLA